MKRPFLILSIIISALNFCYTGFIYNKLPDNIPMHWDINGQIDRYAGKGNAFLMPAIAIFVLLLVVILPKLDPKKANYKNFTTAYDILILGFTLFFMGMNFITLKAAFNPESVNMAFYMPIMIGLLFSLIGFIMPKISSNYFVGIKLPWTLASENNWNKTHKFASLIWGIGGILVALSAFFSSAVSFKKSMAIIFVLVFVPMVYSFILFKKGV